MTHDPAPRRPPVVACRDEASDLMTIADLQDRFRTDPVSLADLHRALADMRARFANLENPEGS